jgi:hypothetical protein
VQSNRGHGASEARVIAGANDRDYRGARPVAPMCCRSCATGLERGHAAIRALAIAAACALLAIGGGTAWWRLATSAYGYRMTVKGIVDGGRRSASSAIELQTLPKLLSNPPVLPIFDLNDLSHARVARLDEFEAVFRSWSALQARADRNDRSPHDASDRKQAALVGWPISLNEAREPASRDRHAPRRIQMAQGHA